MSEGVPIFVTGAAAFAGAFLGQRARLPGGALLGALMGVVALAASGLETTAPSAVRFAALATVGLLVGEGFSRRTVRVMRRAVVPIALSLLVIAVSVSLLAWLLQAVFGLDGRTALLAAVPGGFSSMVALSVATGADVLLVTIIHQVRMLFVIIVVPSILARTLP